MRVTRLFVIGVLYVIAIATKTTLLAQAGTYPAKPAENFNDKLRLRHEYYGLQFTDTQKAAILQFVDSQKATVRDTANFRVSWDSLRPRLMTLLTPEQRKAVDRNRQALTVFDEAMGRRESDREGLLERDRILMGVDLTPQQMDEVRKSLVENRETRRQVMKELESIPEGEPDDQSPYNPKRFELSTKIEEENSKLLDVLYGILTAEQRTIATPEYEYIKQWELHSRQFHLWHIAHWKQLRASPR